MPGTSGFLSLISEDTVKTVRIGEELRLEVIIKITSLTEDTVSGDIIECEEQEPVRSMEEAYGAAKRLEPYPG